MFTARGSDSDSRFSLLLLAFITTGCGSVVIDTKEDTPDAASHSGGGASGADAASASGGTSIEAGMDAADAAPAPIDSGEDAPNALVTDGVTSLVGVDGAALAVGEVALTIPEGALASPTTISIVRIPRASLSSDLLSGLAVYSDVYRFEPSGLRFLKPALVTFNVDTAKGARLAPETSFVFWSEDSAALAYAPAKKAEGFAQSGRITGLSIGFLGAARGVFGGLCNFAEHGQKGGACCGTLHLCAPGLSCSDDLLYYEGSKQKPQRVCR